MSVSEDFQTFYNNIKIPATVVETIQRRFHQIIKRINLDYYNSSSDVAHGLYVGSYGRGTETRTSDIDMIVQLPYDTYAKFDDYDENGQSALLQEVKGVLQKTYGTSHIKGDGQVVAIDFDDGVSFEIVPAFINKDGSSFTYPDTNNGGSWKVTDPRAEIKAMNEANDLTNKNLKRLCMMMRAWRDVCNVPMNGILIDTLAYRFLVDYTYKDKSYLYYDYMCRDFLKYLAELDDAQEYWLAPGSNRRVQKQDNFQYKAKVAYNNSLSAIEYEQDNRLYSSRVKWREIFGIKFPA